MKLTNFLWLIAVPGSLCAQVFYDDFSDGNLRDPDWMGDTSHFIISNERLELRQSLSGTSYLATEFKQSEVKEWRFLFEMDFAPSNNNYLNIYWRADSTTLEKSNNAYLLRIGENGSDDGLKFSRKKAGISTEIATLGDGLFAQGGLFHLRIQKTEDFNWLVSWDVTGGTEFDSLGSFVDSNEFLGDFFGLQCTYTSSNADGFFFDDIYMGPIHEDTVGPKLTNLEVVSLKELFLQFNEAFIPFSKQQITMNPDVIIDTIILDNNDVSILFSDVLENKTNYQLSLSNLEDNKGNRSQIDSSFYFSFVDYFEVRINEIMVDPEPRVQLQNKEYIELYNASNASFSLQDWTIEVNGSRIVFPEIEFAAKSYLLLSSEDYGQSNALTLALPSLTNSGGEITIRNRFDLLVHHIIYSDDWYNEPWKEDGGWSLEMAANAKECHRDEVWQASLNANGGSPGIENSWDLLEAQMNPEISEMVLVSDTLLTLHWNQNFSNSAKESLQLIGTNNLKKLEWDDSNRNSIVLISDSSIEEHGLSFYWLDVSFCEAVLASDTIVIPPIKYPTKGDVLINELLIDPNSNQLEYVEWYTTSDSSLLLSDLRLALGEGGILSQLEICAEDKILILPGQYVVFTEDAALLKNAFPEIIERNLIEVKQLPTMNNEAGEVAIYSSNLQAIESCNYSKTWHLDEGFEIGNALERISFSESNKASNWTTSANTGTPGYKNSVKQKGNQENTGIEVDEFFSPNQDGYQDLLGIHYDFKQSSRLSILVYNEIGVLQSSLVEKQLLQGKGTLFWDGRTDVGTVAEKGIYIVFFDAVDENGNHLIHKHIAVLGGD
ncbi:MAG: hypothetical protein ACI8P7_001287 [Candidatus Azotimanducaceae bacterium]|jgi:hypothetical protein